MAKGHQSAESDAELEAVRPIVEALRDLAYGSVEVTVHDGEIVEIERREKKRMELPVENLESTPDGS